jgi:polyhydroxyalkanoate synthase
MSVVLQRVRALADVLANDPVGHARIGQTSHAIIHRDGPANLRYFAPVEARHTPVLISMPLINTWPIWDLLPHVSVVRALCDAGIPVYLLDWGKPGPEAADRPLSVYVDGVLGRAFDRARRHAAVQHGATGLDAIGYCVGGTFLAAHLARHPAQARRVAFVATPIDFHASGRLALWANAADFPVDTLVDAVGNYPGELMRTSFQFLRPMGQARKWFSLYERASDPAFVGLWGAMERWANDAVDFPGEAYREYIQRCYFDNALIAGGWMMSGSPVDLKNATIPALAIAASDDHIAPEASVTGLARVWGGPVETRTLRGGHVGISVSKSLWDELIAWSARP